DDRDIASVEPVVGIDAIFVLLEIATDDGCAARLEMARADPVPRKDRTGVVDDPKLDSENRAAGPRKIIDLVGVAPTVPIGLISVMPHRCRTRMPRLRNQRMVAGGADDPPTMIVLSLPS